MAPMAGGGSRGGDSRLDHRHHHTSGASRSDDDDDEGGDSKAEICNGNSNGGRSEIRPRSPVAETLFRKDLISAMKLPDNEPLTGDDYWVVADTWKQEWERGVQVPFKPEALPEPHVSRLANPPHSTDRFTFPKKLLCMSRRGTYTSDTHQVTTAALRSEQMCNYDLDELDQRWLNAANGERAQMGVTSISDLEMERTMEELEKQSWEKVNISLKHNEEEEQDDSVICDVCRSPDSEECNEMVFCDSCNICVHQACYGITSIPPGPWLCRTCALGSKPKCELCPNKGGAMKSTKSGQKWAHVSCALWIPEVSIGCVEKMEPITKINSIPQSRWNLLCVLCKDRVGSCIQCSVKTCKVAYHVTCAFKRGLEMRAIIEDENADDGVKLRSYCQKHSMNQKRRESEDSDDDTKGKRKTMTAEERSLARRQKLLKIECEFYKDVDLKEASNKLGVEQDIINFIYRFWILKRKSLGNRPLLIPRSESEVGTGEAGVISAIDGSGTAEQDTEREKLKKFVSLRQDLERVRNLCYMVSRREKLQKSFVKLREQIFEKQLGLVADEANAQQLSLMEMSALLEANHGPTIYDRLFSHADAETHTENDFEVILSRISGEIAENSAQIRKDNPYRKVATPTTIDTKKSWAYKRIFSDTSASETEDLLNMSASMPKVGNRRKRNEGSICATTSTRTAEVAAANAAAMVGKKNNTGKKGNQRGNKHLSSANKKKKQQITSKTKTIANSDSSDIGSSAEDIKDHEKYKQKLNGDRRKVSGATNVPTPANKRLKSKIFSDTDSDAAVDSPSFRPKSPVFRTKAAMKDFGVENLPRGGSKRDEKTVSKLSKTSGRNTNEKSGNKSNKRHHKTSLKEQLILKSKLQLSSGEDVSLSSSDTDLSESDGEKRIRRKKAQENADLGHIMIVPERAAARKATAKLKVSQQDKSAVSEVQDQLAGSGDVANVLPERRQKSKKSKDKELFTATDDSQASEDLSLMSDAFGFVPQRKAAKKASAQIKESDRGKEEGLGVHQSQLSLKKSPVNIRKWKKEGHSGLLLPLSQRIANHSDSDSDEAPFPFRSPREKASRGRGTGGLNKSPRKRAAHGSGRGRASTTASQPQAQQPVKKALSSKAEAFLSARGSQLDVILGRTISTNADQTAPSASTALRSPDKKLKTSEGRHEDQDNDGNVKPSLAGETNTSSTSDVSKQRALDRKKRREERKAKAARRRSSQSSGTTSHSNSSSSSSSTVSSDNESFKRTKNADSKQGEHKDRVLTPRRGDFHNSPMGVGAPATGNSSPAICSPRSMPPTPEQISEPSRGADQKKKDDRYERRIFDTFKENQAPPPTPGRHLTHLIGGSGPYEEAEENNEVVEQGSRREGKYELPSSITSPIVSPQKLSNKPTDNKNERLFEQSPTRLLAGSQGIKEGNKSTKDSSVICSPKQNETNLLPSKASLHSSNKVSGELERIPNDARNASSSQENLHSDIKPGTLPSAKVMSDNQLDTLPVKGSNVMVKQSKQSDEGYGTDAKVSPIEQASSSALLPPKESLALPTVPETTVPQSQEQINSNSQYDLGQLMRNQQQRKQQQMELNRIQQQRQQQEHEKQKLQEQQDQKQQYLQQREHETEQSQWQQQLGQHHRQGQNSQDIDSMQNEAFLNFFYEYHRKASMQQYPHGNNPQNAYSSMTPQQLQQQMRDYPNINTMELFAYYQQYFPQQSSAYNNLLQQQMGQLSGASGTGYNKNDLKAFEQLMMQYTSNPAWTSMNKMSQQQMQQHSNFKEHGVAHNQQHKYQEGQEQMFQYLQQQHQQRQQSQHHNHQNQITGTTGHTSAQSLSHHNQAGYKATSSLLPSTSADDLQPHASSSLGKVQNNSPLVSASAAGSTSASISSIANISQKPRGSRDSPRQYPTQSPRGGGSHIQQGGLSSSITSPSTGNSSLQAQSHHDILSDTAQPVPSATPAEKLPGYVGGKKVVDVKQNAAAESSLSIPKELLESVAAVAKQPVWKPSSERSGDMSPTKSFSGMTPEGHYHSPGKTPASIRDGGVHKFEELVKKVKASPTKAAEATPRSERSHLGSQHEQSVSDFDKSDYDDTKGGVDYDDFDEDDWTKTTSESSKPKRGRPKGSSGSRGRGRGKLKLTASEPMTYTTNATKSNISIIERITKANRGKRKPKHVSIDKKVLEEVHKTVAGTDYDFEDEFGDEFGEEKPPTQARGLSLQALREKSKKARESDEESVDDDLEDLDDIYKSLSNSRGRGALGARGRPRGRGKRGAGSGGNVSVRHKGRGRGRGRPIQSTFRTSRNQSSKSPSDSKSRESGESSDRENDYGPLSGISELSDPLGSEIHPKLPKLKLGALLIKKDSPLASPKLHRSKSGKSGKHHRKSSVDKDGEVAKIPKLTIRLGPKPESKASESSEVDGFQVGKMDKGDVQNKGTTINKANDSVDGRSEVDSVYSKGDAKESSGDFGISSKDTSKYTSIKSSDDAHKSDQIDSCIKEAGDNKEASKTNADGNKSVENPFALNLNELNKDSSNKRMTAKIESGNDKNAAGMSLSKNKASGKVTSSELDTIFGPPGVPLDISTVKGTTQTSSSTVSSINKTSTHAKDQDDQEKSELDLIREELMKDKVESGTPPQASPHPDTIGPLRKAINAAKYSNSSITASNNAADSPQKQTTSSSQVNAGTSNSIIPSQLHQLSSVTQGVEEGTVPSDSNMMKMKFKDLKMKFKSAEFKTDPRKSPSSSSVHHPLATIASNSDPSQRGGGPSLSSGVSSMGSGANSSSSNSSAMGGQPRGSGGGGYARMRKKELLNQYYGQEVYPATPTNGPSSMLLPQGSGTHGHPSMSGMPSSMLPMSSASSSHQYQRPVSFKMPKAVASVTSVPTRADYQSQLEANLERKRKRDKGIADANGGNGKGDGPGKGGDGKGGRKKKGRGKQTDEDPEYKASHLKVSRADTADLSKGGKSSDGNVSSRETARPKTRGKPPKKCLAESPPHDEDKVGDMKAESMKFAAAIRAEFDKNSTVSASSASPMGRTSTGPINNPSTVSTGMTPPIISSNVSQGTKSTTSSLRDIRISRDRNKRKRITDEPSPPPVVSKTPKIVIKFAKDSTKGSAPSTPIVGGNEGSDTAGINSNISSDAKEDGNKNGLDSSPFDFVDNECADAFRPAAQALPMVDGTVDSSAFSSMNNSPATPGTPRSTNSIGSEGSTAHTKLPKIKIKVPTA